MWFRHSVILTHEAGSLCKFVQGDLVSVLFFLLKAPILRIIQLVVLCLYPVSELLEKSVLLWKSALYDVTKGTDTSPRSVTRPTPCFQLLSDMFKIQGGCKQRANPQKEILEIISNWAPDLFNMSDRILHPTTRGLSFFFSSVNVKKILCRCCKKHYLCG